MCADFHWGPILYSPEERLWNVDVIICWFIEKECGFTVIETDPEVSLITVFIIKTRESRTAEDIKNKFGKDWLTTCEETARGGCVRLRNNWCVSIFVVAYKYQCLTGHRHTRGAQVSAVHVPLHRARSDLAICSTSVVGFRNIVYLCLSHSISRNNASLFHCRGAFISSSCSGHLLLWIIILISKCAIALARTSCCLTFSKWIHCSRRAMAGSPATTEAKDLETEGLEEPLTLQWYVHLSNFHSFNFILLRHENVMR